MVERLFHENEVKTNALVSKALIALAGLILTFGVLGRIGVLSLGADWALTVVLITSIVMLLFYAKFKSDNFDKPYIKQALMYLLIFLSALMYFLYTSTTTFLLYGPILLSVKYYDKAFVIKTSIITWTTTMLTIALNTVLYNSFEFFREYKIYMSSAIWSDKTDVLMYIAVPRTIMIVITALFAYYITSDGRDLVEREVDLLTKNMANEAELNTIAGIQSSMMPPEEYASPNGEVRLRAYIKSAKEVGGDFYDYFSLTENLKVSVVADVSDKGLSAAVFGMQVCTVLRYTLMNSVGEGYVRDVESINLEKAVSMINNQIIRRQTVGLFVTALIVCVDARSGVGKFVNAGHCQPYIIHEDGSFELIETEPQPFMGMLPDTEYHATVLNMKSGDIIMMYTDGVTDARNTADTVYGQEGIENVLRRLGEGTEPDASAKLGTGTEFDAGAKLGTGTEYDASMKLDAGAVTMAIANDVNEFIGDADQFDDITILSVHHRGNSEAARISFSIQADMDGISDAVTQINEFLSSNGCPADIVGSADVLVDELCSNIAEYSYGNKGGTIDLECRLGNNAFKLIFRDSGPKFDLSAVDDKVIPAEPEIGGLGIHLVKSIADDLQYEYKDGINITKLIKVWNI